MATPPPAHRTKAAKIRKALKTGAKVTEIDQLWLADYEEKTAAGDNPGSYGRSASKKKVHRQETIEEEQAAEGTGTAAAHAAGMVLMTREEGRQLDKVLTIGVDALKAAVDVYKKAFEDLAADRIEDRKAMRELMGAVREAFVSEAEAQAALVEQQAQHDAEEKAKGGDETQALALTLLAKHLGVDLDTLAAGAAAPKKPANGTPPKKPAA